MKITQRSALPGKDFSRTFLRLVVPITLQQLVFSLLNLITVMMVGQLGEASVAAVGLANQITFLFQLFLFGVGSGAAVFVAQFWGKHDIRNIRRVLSICLGMGLVGATIFTAVALVMPEWALGVYSADQTVVELGSQYLRIVGLCYVPLAISTSYAITLRSTGNVRLPVTVSVLALSLGAVLNYVLIFGDLGLPALGVQGSAFGTMIARFVECALLLVIVYSMRSPIAASPRDLRSFDRVFLFLVLKTMIPVTLNEIIWSLGISTYNLIYAHIGTESVAAVSIAGTIENLAFVPFIGVANSAAVMIGHCIGAGDEDRAFEYAKRFIQLVVGGGMLIGAAIFLSAEPVLDLYRIDSHTHQFARNVLIIMSIALFVKVSNMILIVGILRAGGDARVSALIDVGTLWLVGLPAATLGAFVFGLPVYWVYALTILDEICKVMIASWRMISKKWIRNLARQHPQAA
jgi:MATE family, multidrug efflux pump